MSARALHYVFKIGNRKQSIDFYKTVLKMKVLRHEEFAQGCEAACNGPYNGKWSKTMIGYGPESNHFVAELTYNYEISDYEKGNDYQGITINHPEVYKLIKAGAWPFFEEDTETIRVDAPGGYPYFIKNINYVNDPVVSVAISCTDVEKSREFWSGKCCMKVIEQIPERIRLTYGDNQCHLVLNKINVPLNRAKAYGRIAFACPTAELPKLEKHMKESGEKILTPLLSLPTPGKATVVVLILADPNDHEICFVGDEAFTELSLIDEKSDAELEKAITEDDSDAWFSKRGGKPKSQ